MQKGRITICPLKLSSDETLQIHTFKHGVPHHEKTKVIGKCAENVSMQIYTKSDQQHFIRVFVLSSYCWPSRFQTRNGVERAKMFIIDDSNCALAPSFT